MIITRESSYLLDVMRVIAAQMVLVGHALGLIGLASIMLPSMGVVVFFVLSGYLIACSAQRSKERGEDFWVYCLRRFGRIYSALIPCLILIAAIDAWLMLEGLHTYPQNYSVKDFLYNMLMLQNAPSIYGHAPFGQEQFGTGRPLWTLSLEWWLYMAFGVLFFLGARLREWRVWLLFAFVAYVPFMNAINDYAGGIAWIWVMGAACFLSTRHIQWQHVSLKQYLFAAAICIGMILMHLKINRMPDGTSNAYDMRFMVYLSVGLLALILATQYHAAAFAKWVCKPATMRFMADYSYTLYLIHYSVCTLIAKLALPFAPIGVFVLAFVLSNALAILLAYVTEFRHRQFSAWLIARWPQMPRWKYVRQK